MWLDVNGRRRQSGNTRTMIFGVAALVAYISRFMTLDPGDLITTGTPPGVGMGRKPAPVYLQAGDVMHLGIAKLGEQISKPSCRFPRNGGSPDRERSNEACMCHAMLRPSSLECGLGRSAASNVRRSSTRHLDSTVHGN